MCDVRDLRNRKIGPFKGIVKGLASNEDDVEWESRLEFDATGLLVEIPELGVNECYREWPVRFTDAEIMD